MLELLSEHGRLLASSKEWPFDEWFDLYCVFPRPFKTEPDASTVCVFDGWDALQLGIMYVWHRPPRPTEESKKIQEERGPQQIVPDDWIKLGVQLDSLIFWDSKGRRPVGIVRNHFAASLRVDQAEDVMMEYLKNIDRVALEDAEMEFDRAKEWVSRRQ
jgi:hypothetical protein